MRRFNVRVALFLIIFLLSYPIVATFIQATSETKQYIHDAAHLLNEDEVAKLESLAEKYSAKRETDFIILSTDDPKGKDVKQYTEDFYDENAPGFGQPHGNAIILTVDMKERELYIATFYLADQYVGADRRELIREKITPDLTKGKDFAAFQTFLHTSYKYMGIKPGVDPNNILFKSTFQISASLVIAAVVVGLMAYHSGGKVTVSGSTYENQRTSKVLKRKDQYIRTSVSKRRKPSNRNKGGPMNGGGGGGITRGGHSYGGTRGKF